MMVQDTHDRSVQGAVYRTLKEGIMTLRLAPGTVMSTKEMAERLHVSRTPVREAFIRLQGEELVDIIPSGRPSSPALICCGWSRSVLCGKAWSSP